jgi:hypothetical protein
MANPTYWLIFEAVFLAVILGVWLAVVFVGKDK